MKIRNRPIISVVIPVYNVEKYLPECIDSILAQEFVNFELILVNDGSPDNCENICQEYVRRDRRVRYFYQDNAGVAVARNLGMSVAKGKYIYLMDSDDAIDVNFLKYAYDSIKTMGGDFIVLGDCVKDRMPWPPALPTFATFFKRDILKRYPDIKQPVGVVSSQDGVFSHMLLAVSNKISFDGRPIYFYRQHEGQITKRICDRLEKYLSQVPYCFDVLNKFYQKHSLYERCAGHLARFIEHEPFEYRLMRLPFEKSQKIELFNLIKSFMTTHVMPYITEYDMGTLKPAFRLLLDSSDYDDFVIKLAKLNDVNVNVNPVLAPNRCRYNCFLNRLCRFICRK